MRFLRNAGPVVLCAVLLTGCGGDSNDPTPFDPAGIQGDLASTNAIFSVFDGDAGQSLALAAEHLNGGGGPILEPAARMLRAAITEQGDSAAEQLLAATRTIARSRMPQGGAAVILPAEILGTTFVWDAGTGEYVASERTDADDNGVRFVLYAINPVSGEPATPLNELGYVDVLDLSTATADIGRIVVVAQGVTYFDYRVAASGTGSDADIDVTGFISNGEDRLNFDLANHFSATATTERLTLDYELEYPAIQLTMDHQIEIFSQASGMTIELESSLRGAHGYVDMSGLISSGDAGSTTELAFEVNGDEFATVSCPVSGECVMAGAGGAELTEQEEGALGMFFVFWQYGLLLSGELMSPVGAFFPI